MESKTAMEEEAFATPNAQALYSQAAVFEQQQMQQYQQQQSVLLQAQQASLLANVQSVELPPPPQYVTEAIQAASVASAAQAKDMMGDDYEEIREQVSETV
jgi:hypothetical protein